MRLPFGADVNGAFYIALLGYAKFAVTLFSPF